MANPEPDRLRIVVLGYLVRGPLGGLAWHHLQYVLGLHRLGHDVYFLEDSDDFPGCYDPERNTTDVDPTYGLRFAAHAFDQLGMGDRWGYYDAHTDNWLGPAGEHLLRVCAGADLLLNLSGVNPVRPWTDGIPVRVLVDTDPVFTQIRHLTDLDARRRAAHHTAFFSFAENIGRSECTVPVDGFPWQATRQPVVLDVWPATPGPERGKITTVMQWDSYPAQEWDGRWYGMKSRSFPPFLDLPKRAGRVFELAIGSPNAPRDLLEGNGWSLRDPLPLSRDPWTYQQYLQASRAEFGLAKHGYVVSRSGWFSERSAGYLASSRPVLAHDTGFSTWLRAPGGVLPFGTPEEAVAGVEEIGARYTFHCRAARAVAEEYFDAGKVLTNLLERVTGTSAVPHVQSAP